MDLEFSENDTLFDAEIASFYTPNSNMHMKSPSIIEI